MVRRTKAEAEQTRECILDAAEEMFFEHGVSRTTLEKIAKAAGVTRGAIYWHFQNKADLYDAMLDRIRLPFHGSLATLSEESEQDPIDQIRNVMIEALNRIATNEQHFRILMIVFHRSEYIDELNPAVCRHEESKNEAISFLEQGFVRAKEKGLLKADLDPRLAAAALNAYVGGLISQYLLHPEQCDLSKKSQVLIDIMLDGFRA